MQVSQRALIAARMANLGNGQRADEVSGTSIEVAAKIFGIGRASVERAKSLLTSGDDELIKNVASGKVSVSAATSQLAHANKTATPPISNGEIESKRLLKLWNKTGEEGQTLFLDGIGATI